MSKQLNGCNIQKKLHAKWFITHPPYSLIVINPVLWLIWPHPFSWVQSLSRVWLFVTPWTAAHQASLSSPTPGVHPNPCPSSRWCHPTISSSVVPFSSCPQSFPASGSFHESVLRIRWPKYWSFSFSISPSSEYSGLISFRMDWLDLLAVQGTLKSLLQHHSSKASILRRSAFFMVQLSHPYMTTGKTIALIIILQWYCVNIYFVDEEWEIESLRDFPKLTSW